MIALGALHQELSLPALVNGFEPGLLPLRSLTVPLRARRLAEVQGQARAATEAHRALGTEPARTHFQVSEPRGTRVEARLTWTLSLRVSRKERAALASATVSVFGADVRCPLPAPPKGEGATLHPGSRQGAGRERELLGRVRGRLA